MGDFLEEWRSEEKTIGLINVAKANFIEQWKIYF